MILWLAVIGVFYPGKDFSFGGNTAWKKRGGNSAEFLPSRRLAYPFHPPPHPPLPFHSLPGNRGAMKVAVVVIYALTAVIGGYVSATLYNRMGPFVLCRCVM